MNTIQSNIINLTSLWRSATQPFNTYNEDKNIGYCFIPNSQWPNKIWLKKEHNPEILNEIKLLLKSELDGLTFTYFDLGTNGENKIFDYHDFDETSIQFGMSLKLSKKVKISKQLKFKLVTNINDSQIWSQSFYKAFGYIISEETLNKTFHHINYYLIYDQENIIGTVISHQTNSTIGIHSLGILPNMRGNGYATQIMHQLLNNGLEQGCNLATLQASKMAKSMYEKMGFTTELIMRNYKLKTQ
ncbi:GNAT family N-acetyltransferase [Flavobacteriaceae bacterium S0825]|uniref:GNAT family N-acetyltransferase n=1 Tax=Gaetbulibacter sp. S0825 TaxID=2720084 RepID=UPI001431A28B|nr:GNAT family N-acetyltransferase [Gaetbulibacter sp. S0825]MCK0107899.1 GNAT family N-acetyltransferase [Flavobacteriaceae bacterium S0825]NIX63535.1 GNAT family N-acetyltransferase [Gaetbulibacter sp. S0825]